jgi:hypothetical protein
VAGRTADDPARTEIAGLPVGKTSWFRVRVVRKDGEQDFGAPLSTLVT